MSISGDSPLLWVLLKKTIARVFVLLVSLGYGVVKPTLGTVTIYKVAGLGVLFFICTAAYDLHDTPGAAPDFAKSVLAIPLSLVNAIFFWWILVELYGVYRSLELKHQELKMKMYKNLGIFLLVILLLSLASGVFEVYCAQNRLYDHYWEIYWLQYAIWHMLFFAVLVFIVIVWRPTSNNTRYAYTALDSDDDDGETNGAPTPTGFGDIKLRTRESYKQDDADENLQWAEENIPTASQALVAALDEETNAEDIETWRSKMQ